MADPGRVAGGVVQAHDPVDLVRGVGYTLSLTIDIFQEKTHRVVVIAWESKSVNVASTSYSVLRT